MLIDVLSLVEQDTGLRRASFREQSGPCPNPKCRCQTDGFRVKWNGEKYVFMCRGCWDASEYLPEKDRKRGWGDEIDYLRHYREMSFRQAKAFLGGQVEGDEERRAPLPKSSSDFQDAASHSVTATVKAMWGEDTRGLLYARSRGLNDDMIRNAQLGYALVGSTPYLYIPSHNDGRYVAVMRRNLLPDVPHEERWKDLGGSVKSELYLADVLRRKKPTVLCEDAFSALSIWQEASDLVNVVATCGATSAQEVKWIGRLARMPLVLVDLDADEDGDKSAGWWLHRLPNAQRLRPLLKDANDMLVAGWDVRAWIDQALSLLSTEPVKLEGDEIPRSFSRPCARCGRIGEACRRSDGLVLCSCYWTWQVKDWSKS